MPKLSRCSWCANDMLMAQYHDEEWGVPLYDDARHYEFLVLEAMQAGLSWRTVLYKRENFRAAFAGFDPAKVARFTPARIEKLLLDPGIIRNRLKVEAAVANARAVLKLQAERGSFSDYLWEFADGRPIVGNWQHCGEIPAVTDLAAAVSKDLKARGFKFVGPTVIYAHLQAAGIVNDHTVDCFRYKAVQKLVRK